MKQDVKGESNEFVIFSEGLFVEDVMEGFGEGAVDDGENSETVAGEQF